MKQQKREKTIIMSEIMTPNMANFLGNIHGGYILSFLDKVAYACGSRYAGLSLVTLSVDQVFFKEPVHVGELLTCYASVNFVGSTSMEVGIRVEAEDLRSGNKRHTNSCYFTLVALDDAGKPAKLPAYTPESENEKRRFAEAKQRRDIRFKLYKDKHTNN